MKKLITLTPLALIQLFCAQEKFQINQQPEIVNKCSVECLNRCLNTRLSTCIGFGSKGPVNRDEKNAEEWLSLSECQKSCSTIEQNKRCQESIEPQKRSLTGIWTAITNLLKS